MGKQRNYPTNLSDKPWHRIEPLLPQPKSQPGHRGRPATDLRLMLNGSDFDGRIDRSARTVRDGAYFSVQKWSY